MVVAPIDFDTQLAVSTSATLKIWTIPALETKVPAFLP